MTTKLQTYSFRIEPDEQGGYVVTVPALPGCVTQADSYEEALAMAQEAIEGFLEALVKAGQPIPHEKAPTGPREGHLLVRTPVAV